MIIKSLKLIQLSHFYRLNDDTNEKNIICCYSRKTLTIDQKANLISRIVTYIIKNFQKYLYHKIKEQNIFHFCKKRPGIGSHYYWYKKVFLRYLWNIRYFKWSENGSIVMKAWFAFSTFLILTLLLSKLSSDDDTELIIIVITSILFVLCS